MEEYCKREEIAILDVINTAKKAKYATEMTALINHLVKLQKVISAFDESVGYTRYGHQSYASDWTGGTRSAYDSLVDELKMIENNVYDIHKELISEIKKEISNLAQKVKELE